MLDIWPRGRLVDLPTEDCWEALRHHEVGRIAWCHGGRPRVLPVNYVADDHGLWICTAPYSRLAQEAHDGWVALEIDDIDPFQRSGTSVVVEGRCRRDDLREARPVGVTTWVEGTRTLVLRVVAEQVTGRRLLPS